MESALTGVTVITWLYAMVQQARALATTERSRMVVHLAGWCGVVSYLLFLALSDNPTDLRIGTVLAFTASIVVACSLLAAVRLPLNHLFVIVFPAAALCVAVGAFLPSAYQARDVSIGLMLHVLLSAMAYATLCLGACQAVILAWQERTLRRGRSLTALQALPPLTHMEELLFQFVWLGLGLLSAAIASGLLFLSDLFAQRVVHHTVLSLSSWGVFALLLWGRHALGWRGVTAIRWTLAGFALLVLAYFGSKVMIEIILPAAQT